MNELLEQLIPTKVSENQIEAWVFINHLNQTVVVLPYQPWGSMSSNATAITIVDGKTNMSAMAESFWSDLDAHENPDEVLKSLGLGDMRSIEKVPLNTDKKRNLVSLSISKKMRTESFPCEISNFVYDIDSLGQAKA